MLTLLLMSAAYLTYIYVDGNDPDWAVVTMSITQISASGLIIFLLLIFAERGTNEQRLREKSKDFMENMITSSINENELTSSNGMKTPLKCEILHSDGPLVRFYKIYAEGNEKNHMTFSLLFNLKRFALYLYLPKTTKMFKNLKDAEDYFAHGMTIARGIGYSCSITESHEEFFGQRCYMLAFTQETLSDDFIDKPINKLFYAQDISLMLKWYLSQRIAGKIDFL